jgi:hypothetical protein
MNNALGDTTTLESTYKIGRYIDIRQLHSSIGIISCLSICIQMVFDRVMEPLNDDEIGGGLVRSIESRASHQINKVETEAIWVGLLYIL